MSGYRRLRALQRRRPRRGAWLRSACLWLALLVPIAVAQAEDGYDLWLRYQPLAEAQAAPWRAAATELVAGADTPMQRAARDELRRGLGGLLGAAPPLAASAERAGAIVLGTPATPAIARLRLDTRGLGEEGYLIRSVVVDGRPLTAIVGGGERGVLYAAFRFLRLLQTGQAPAPLALRDAPRVKLRVLDHWDNLDGVVERGYAGASLWGWQKLPDYIDPRYTDYARANASIGINGAVLNNVNAEAVSLTVAYLDKTAALAAVLRPYGIRVYLSARFSAPIEIGGLRSADPLDPAVQRWWRVKADEIYGRIPDFGGFLVKANSEGQPGPQDYGRSHADGANMLADALAPHGGVVMWRAFVYAHQQPDDRAKQAYGEFVPLDGKFHDNVVVQVKNGAIDFQPREPFHPLFGAMPKTPLMLEFQITKEYLGFATHLVYLGTLYQETLQADTRRGKRATVARVVEGAVDGHALSGIAGVANIGADRNWCGSIFDQANWYAFGRLAWDPQGDAQAIAEDWVRMTFGNDPALVAPVVGMMMASHEAAVDYMTPLGLHHLMGRGHHYGPAPWDAGSARPDWDPVYYHRADRNGIGFDRSATGSNAVAQYAPPLARRFGDLRTVPEDYLLWFHHVPWDHRMASGRPLWEELIGRYDHGVAQVARMRATWAGLAPYVDAQRYRQVADFLAIQQREAQWWRDASIAYWQQVSGRALPPGTAPPPHPLAYYQSLSFPYAPGNPK
ncbi:alpha-glucuronidase [Xanthomonas translucens pv. undulosa]|nr:alpha-glucuronidase family glycosyl hydrolase [Xanthomonas translucens]MCT8272575.1 alpha-glucuronidase [Xanthomonas translucens pv. undulosa]QSQ52412.1 alpha-glucuronidase [Xanthomonas translucens pv. undulosa]QSQ58668.1 alpha-glucuronidase [Xanthomonas translucens pv. undulosa]UNU10987.1 alpha-glucuronidase [Xanthomonas translucens pv. translucens]WNJ29337.1 alpha-glucuronidase family glycosyl hydrolase [Xanthomonas translucens pv. undulosa]